MRIERLLAKVLFTSLLGVTFWSCNGSDRTSGTTSGERATGGTSAKASGASEATGGAGQSATIQQTASGGSSAKSMSSGKTTGNGGTTASVDSNETAVVQETGGTKPGTGGADNKGSTTAKGGADNKSSSSKVSSGGTSDTGDDNTGGRTRGTGTGGGTVSGATGGGPAWGGSNAGGASTGGLSGIGGSTGKDSCVKGQTKGNQVLIIGDSFIQLSTIPAQIEKGAVAAGSLADGTHYINSAVSGMTLAGNNANSIPNQYANAAKSGGIKYVLMDGGGNDCLLNNNGDAALAAAKTLFQSMGKDKIEKVQYFFYPDPVGSDRVSLKSCIDKLRPQMQALCEGLSAPKCYWLDLRPTWGGHNEYTSDGIHPTAAGSVATGDVVWKEMVKNCIAQ